MVNTQVNTVNEVSQEETTNEAALIKEFASLGLTVTLDQIPEVLQKGADAFLHRAQVNVPDKKMTGLYLIINELRNNN